MFYNIRNRKGMALFLAMIFIGFMALSGLSLSTMMQNDSRLIRRVKQKEAARFVAEAGANHGLAKIMSNGFASRANFSGSLDTGTYVVTYSTVGTRYLITSVGTVSGNSETVTAEINQVIPSATSYAMVAGNNIQIKSFTGVTTDSINGDIQANNNIQLYAQASSKVTVTGDVAAHGTITEGSIYKTADTYDTNVYINGVNKDAAAVTESATAVTFPTFNLAAYKTAAQSGGTYYSTNKTFTSTTLTPSGGVVYVDGTVTISGTVNLNGGLVANSVTISKNAVLNMVKTGTRNVLITTAGNISVTGSLTVGEGLVYSSQDLSFAGSSSPTINITGVALAGRDIVAWNAKNYLIVNYVSVTPPDMTVPSTKLVVSWNK